MAAVRHAYSPTTPISDQAPDPVLKSSEFGSAPWAYPADSISCRQVRGDRVIKVGIVGATGYTGVELLRLLVRHPGVQVAVITSRAEADRKSTRLNSSHVAISYAVFCLKKKNHASYL